MAGQTVVVSVLADTNRFTKAFQSVGGAVGKLGAGIAAGVGVGAVALAKLGKAAVDSASSLQQFTGAVDAVFKGQAAQVHKWAKSAWKDLGLSETAYSQAASLIGSQLKNMGIPTKALGKQTNDLVKRGADLAAQFGGTTAEAVGALSALLRGETDPIERYGISIKQADIKAQMLADGTAKLTGAQAKAARTQAIMTLLSKQSADAMGANAREAGTWEGVTQRLAGWWENLKAQLGGPIIAVLSALVAKFTAFSDQMIKTAQFTAFLGWLKTLGDGLASSAGHTAGLVGQVVSLVRSFSPLGILLRAVQPILPQLAASFTKIGATIAAGLAAVLPSLTPLLDQVAGLLGGLIASLLPPMVQLVGQLSGTFVQLLPPVAALVSQLVGALAPILLRLTPLVSLLAQVVGQVLAAALPVASALIGALSATITALTPALDQIVTAVLDVATAAAPMLVQLGQLLSVLLPPLIGITGQFATTLVGLLAPAVRAASAPISAIIRVVAAVVGWFATAVTASVKAGDGINGAWGKVAAFLGTFAGKVGAIFAKAGAWLLDAGRQLLAGLWNGVNDKVAWLRTQIGNAMDGVVDWVKHKFGIASPSKVFRKIGTQLTAGLGVGVTDTLDRATSAIDKLISAINKAATKGTRKVAAGAVAELKAQQKTTKALWQADDLSSARTIAAALASNGRWTAQASAQLRGSTLADIAKARGALTQELTAQTNVLKDLVSQHGQLRDQIAGSLTGSLDLGSTLRQRSDGTFEASWSAMTAQVGTLKAKALALAGKMRQLVAMGLPPVLVQQIAALGLDKAGAVADAFLNAPASEVGSYVADFAAFNDTAAAIGTTLADQMFGAGIAAQQGIVNGLLADQDKLSKAAEQIADTIEKTIKRKLKIKSPSRVMAGIARNVVAGIRLVLGDTRGVASDMVKLSDAVAGNFDPNLTMAAAAGPLPATGGVTVNITVNGALDPRQTARAIRDLLTTDARLRGVLAMNGQVLT